VAVLLATLCDCTQNNYWQDTECAKLHIVVHQLKSLRTPGLDCELYGRDLIPGGCFEARYQLKGSNMRLLAVCLSASNSSTTAERIIMNFSNRELTKICRRILILVKCDNSNGQQ
jgi:hypothetical protein